MTLESFAFLYERLRLHDLLICVAAVTKMIGFMYEPQKTERNTVAYLTSQCSRHRI